MEEGFSFFRFCVFVFCFFGAENLRIDWNKMDKDSGRNELVFFFYSFFLNFTRKTNIVNFKGNLGNIFSDLSEDWIIGNERKI